MGVRKVKIFFTKEKNSVQGSHHPMIGVGLARLSLRLLDAIIICTVYFILLRHFKHEASVTNVHADWLMIVFLNELAPPHVRSQQDECVQHCQRIVKGTVDQRTGCSSCKHQQVGVRIGKILLVCIRKKVFEFINSTIYAVGYFPVNVSEKTRWKQRYY